jgi:hypothetical protein
MVCVQRAKEKELSKYKKRPRAKTKQEIRIKWCQQRIFSCISCFDGGKHNCYEIVFKQKLTLTRSKKKKRKVIQSKLGAGLTARFFVQLDPSYFTKSSSSDTDTGKSKTYTHKNSLNELKFEVWTSLYIAVSFLTQMYITHPRQVKLKSKDITQTQTRIKGK